MGLEDRATMLRAIIGDPDDDSPRLVYADWLDDHAEFMPNTESVKARAEFIRTQVELARRESAQNGDSEAISLHSFEKGREDVIRFKKRESELKSRWLKEWNKEYESQSFSVDSWTRGFPDAFRIRQEVHPNDAAALSDITPIGGIVVDSEVLSHTVTSLPFISQIKSLHIIKHQGEDYSYLLSAPELTGLTHLRISENIGTYTTARPPRLLENEVRAIADNPALKNLQNIDISQIAYEGGAQGRCGRAMMVQLEEMVSSAYLKSLQNMNFNPDLLSLQQYDRLSQRLAQRAGGIN